MLETVRKVFAGGHRKERGFSLIEAMLAMVILTAGMLGLAAMQDLGMSANLSANDVSVATNLAQDMLDRIKFAGKADSRRLVDYNGINTTNPATMPLVTRVSAQSDYIQWRDRLNATNLFNPIGEVFVTATGPVSLNQSTVNVQVSWGAKANFFGRRVNMITLTGAE